MRFNDEYDDIIIEEAVVAAKTWQSADHQLNGSFYPGWCSKVRAEMVGVEEMEAW